MAEEKAELREVNYRQLMPWTELFRGFQVALDPKKLLLAAAGLVVMAAGWWLLAVIFYSSRAEPTWAGGAYEKNWSGFKADRHKWNLLNEAAGNRLTYTTADDLAETPEEYDAIKKEIDEGHTSFDVNGRHFEVRPKPYGEMRTWPWFEDRGPNPYLLVTGQESNPDQGTARFGPWQRGQFVNWFVTEQVPVLIEPLRKLLRPVIFLLHPRAGFWNQVYFSLVVLWTLGTWALFGGAITRMAAVQLARRDRISLGESLRFTVARYLSFLSAPLFPLIFLVVIVIFCSIYGLLHLIPVFGDIVVDGLFWPLVLLAGLVMTVILIGLVGWPMMYATISAEGSDSFDALSRSYSYVYQSPWHYIWYSLVAIVYGAVVLFFVGFAGSLTVYLAKWGVSQTPGVEWANREPSYLFVYTPTSYGWRDLLLQGASVNGQPIVVPRQGINWQAYDAYVGTLTWYNMIGAGLVAFWIYLVFLAVVGFGYSYFWSASTIIYLLMRRNVDDTDLDEVYLEEDEGEEAYTATAPVSPPVTAGAPLTMVDAPTLKTTANPPPAPAAPKVETVPGNGGDGNPPA